MPLDEIVTANRNDGSRGITSVCSAHPVVLEAALAQARADGTAVLVEATSNQVDQFGGYTGRTPAAFRGQVAELARRAGLPDDRVLLGGDHLGPHRWRAEPAEQAMAKADDLVAAYAGAGFTKLHLDCSYPCADDPGVLSDEVMAERAARLARVAVAAAGDAADGLRFVIGTEVPVPGGAEETIDELTVTPPDAAAAALATHRDAFAGVGLADTWPHVVALVVQPGVEFDHARVVDYAPDRTVDLQKVLLDEPRMVFEAHSTDYQTGAALRALVRDHWAVLKVGPGLTFALREGYVGLAAIERELVPAGERSELVETVERRMLARPEHWRGYYPGDAEQQRLARRYSYSDRMRYYWPDRQIDDAVARLESNLAARGVPETLLAQYLPDQYRRVRRGQLAAHPRALVVDKVRDVLRTYAAACRPDPHEEPR